MKHGKTKEQEAEEVALVQALAEKRLREVCNLFSERNLCQNWKYFCNLDQNWKYFVTLVRIGKHFETLIRIGNILQPWSELEIFLQP